MNLKKDEQIEKLSRQLRLVLAEVQQAQNKMKVLSAGRNVRSKTSEQAHPKLAANKIDRESLSFLAAALVVTASPRTPQQQYGRDPTNSGSQKELRTGEVLQMTKNRIYDLFAVAMLIMTIAATTVAQAQNFSVLYNFGTKSGDPYAPQNAGIVAQGRDGNLYSTAPNGGTSGFGTAFKITPAGTVTVLYSFDGPREKPHMAG